MISQKVSVRTDHSEAELTTYFQEPSRELAASAKRPVVLICPGGGYEFVSDREAEPVARPKLYRYFQNPIFQRVKR